MNQEIISLFKNQEYTQSFDHIRITLASPEKIHSWSFGEVKKPETINYRTFKPERDGLFCGRIFGPNKDYECQCGKYKRKKFKGVICERCGVEITLSSVRRERMGHIELAAPVAHIWFLKSLPSRIGLLLNMQLKDLESILYFDKHVVLEPGLTALQHGELLNEKQFIEAQDEYGKDSFTAMIGAEAVQKMLISLDLNIVSEQIRGEMKESKTELKLQKLAKRLTVVENFLNSPNLPEWMILTVIPVIPPDLRPLIPLDGGRFAASDLNDLYRRVINRNNRLKRLLELNAPVPIIRNQKRMLQESVDALFDNGRRGRTITGSNRRPLKSLSDMLKGKQGRFRQNLLGKRVDYSGRSVITVGPELKLHQCGLPKKMALELFKPFIYSRLEARGYSHTAKQSKKLVEKERPEVWDILEEVIREHPIMLNRAPTLHRLGIQAFEPILIKGKAIQLHPLVCTTFNADFDGDQMSVHVPLSLEAQLEARTLMMSTNNILHPANGQPVIVPSQDIVLGLYYLSIEKEKEPGEGMIIADMGELQHALENNVLSLHSKIKSRYKTVDAQGDSISYICDTTPGRLIIGELLPKHHKVSFEVCNREMTKNEISNMIDAVYRACGQKTTVIFCDKIMELGFLYACKSGISFGKDDMVVPPQKFEIVSKSYTKVEQYEKQFNDGLITQGEKYNKVVDEWSKCTDRVAEEMVKSIESTEKNEDGRQGSLNSIYMMSKSGACGSPAQMKQIAGMRGLMARPDGSIIENPIISNFKEGLNVLEYFISTHGGRKGLADTALKTANSGYLTRRLVNVAQDSIISVPDCGTENGISMHSIVDAGKVIVTLGQRILGRVVSEDLVDSDSGEIIVPVGKLIEEEDIEKIESAGIQMANIRSAITCEAKTGVCATCYGRDLARGTPVNIGEAVGVVAAQSIGEPGSQLTMRTFHIGGAAQGVEISLIKSNVEGIVRICNRNVERDSNDNLIAMARNMTITIQDTAGNERSAHRIPYGAKLFVDDGDEISSGTYIAEWDPYSRPILAETSGKVEFEDIEDGSSIQENLDEETGITKRIVIEWRDSARTNKLKPAIVLCDKTGNVIKTKRGLEIRTLLSPGAVLSVNAGDTVKAGDVLARFMLKNAKTKDITGGLPRVAELFEARRPKEKAILAEISGTIRFGKKYNTKTQIFIDPYFDEETRDEKLKILNKESEHYEKRLKKLLKNKYENNNKFINLSQNEIESNMKILTTKKSNLERKLEVEKWVKNWTLKYRKKIHGGDFSKRFEILNDDKILEELFIYFYHHNKNFRKNNEKRKKQIIDNKIDRKVEEKKMNDYKDSGIISKTYKDIKDIFGGTEGQKSITNKIDNIDSEDKEIERQTKIRVGDFGELIVEYALAPLGKVDTRKADFKGDIKSIVDLKIVDLILEIEPNPHRDFSVSKGGSLAVEVKTGTIGTLNSLLSDTNRYKTNQIPVIKNSDLSMTILTRDANERNDVASKLRNELEKENIFLLIILPSKKKLNSVYLDFIYNKLNPGKKYLNVSLELEKCNNEIDNLVDIKKQIGIKKEINQVKRKLNSINRKVSELTVGGKEKVSVEYIIPQNSNFHLQEGDVVEKGDPIIEGDLAPEDILETSGVEAVACYLVNEIQQIYRLQGVDINDKHIEILVRQMLQRYEIVDPGQSNFLKAELIHKIDYEEANERLIEDGKQPIIAKPVLQGITKASFHSRSFFSAASFQETTRVLTEAAISGKRDMLKGMKENIIVGRLVPVGTGAIMEEIRGIAKSRDQSTVENKMNQSFAKAEELLEDLSSQVAD